MTPQPRPRSGPAGGTPDPPTGRLVVRPPPERPESEGAGGGLLNVVPMLGSLGSLVLVSSMGGQNRARGLVAAALILFATVGFVLVQVDRQRTQRARRQGGSRAAYLRHLAHVRARARDAARQQRAALTQRHPDPGALPALAGEHSRLWPGDAAAPLAVRFGRCPQPPALELVAEDEDGPDGGAAGGGGPADPASAAARSRLLAVHRVAPDLPATVDLRTVDRLELCGAGERARSLARALVCSAASGHGPDRLEVAVLCGRADLPHWDWVKWLPHARSAGVRDAAGPARMVATDLDDLLALLPEAGPDAPHLLLVADGIPAGPDRRLSPEGTRGATVLDLPEEWGALDDAPDRLRLELTAHRRPGYPRDAVLVLRPGAPPVVARADRCPLATAEAFARRLAPVLPGGSAGTAGRGGSSAPPDVAGLLGLGDVALLDPAERWVDRPEPGRLRVPIGVSDDGAPVHLDLKEAAQQGMGPHGLVVGATGSGKSELLRTLVLGLATTHGPEQLNMVLVDFKGGATFAGLAELPHVSAVITNLEAELTLVDRMQDALHGEIVRRQEALRGSGHASVRDHERARAAGADLEPLPSLFVVVDEFSEMLSARPELIDTFVAIGRLGRSLGLHLLLASQRLEEGRLRGLESHLSYRVGLRTFSAGESRAVLGVPDAATLPTTPGVGFLRPDPASLVRFRAAYASGPPPRDAAAAAGRAEPAPGILPFSVAPLPAPVPAASAGPTPPEMPADRRPSVLDLAVDRMVGAGPRARRIWLPPLERPDTLGALMPDLAADPAQGLVSRSWRDRGPHVVPVGAVDRPREQRRETLTVDLRESGGHLAVVGAPRSGKSTLLASTVSGLALTTTPLETQVLVLDFGGGTCAALADLPHVAGVASRADPEVVRRVVAEAAGILRQREVAFREQGIDSMQAYRERRARGTADDGWGDVFVVVDGWATLRADFEGAEEQLERLAATGLTYGVHLLVAATRWAELRPALRDVLGTRLELRLGDPLDSEVDRREAARVPAGRPGRGLTPDAYHFLGALPALERSGDPASHADGPADLVDRCARARRGPAGPRLRLLPPRIDLDGVRRDAAAGGSGARRLLLGLDERRLEPVALDPDRDPHLLVLGESGSGKTAALRGYAHEVMRSRTPAEAQLVVVDYRRSLLGEVPDDYLLDHLTGAAAASPALGDLAAHLEDRLPPPGVTVEQLRDRSWWTGPDVFVLVDDYDLVATARDSPVAALEHLLAQARDVGLHVVVARRSGGASRALHEPVLQSLRDLAMPGLLLAGSPDEGPLLGPLRPEPAVPGRARLLTRDRGTEVLQLAWSPAAGAGPTRAPRARPGASDPRG